MSWARSGWSKLHYNHENIADLQWSSYTSSKFSFALGSKKEKVENEVEMALSKAYNLCSGTECCCRFSSVQPDWNWSLELTTSFVAALHDVA